MDQGVIMTSSHMVLHLHRLSPRLSLPTSWAPDLEPWKDQAITPQTTKGLRTWYLTLKPRVQSRVYRAPCSPSLGRRTAAGPALRSPWPVIPATALRCPIRAKRWEKVQPGKGTNHRDYSWLDVSLVNSGDEMGEAYIRRAGGTAGVCTGGERRRTDGRTQRRDVE